ncbi:D-alanyl-D-alanine carboxypeptidase/D-alanyl-D-alanine carboxypeptidase (penicillin-binding protein 5/6) [Cohnella sp. SGD-V74]|uniref:D-alanyl-D-alanine carboxypeptidase family protein n=1 Tax=unclassified Cohnella TaxID=2636738 RepID=UPI000D43D155|nr:MULTISPECIES: D-alanyl-D-alanine carboxypeptidase family protein [unclassified Cohnella]PRX65097.1 D-alanyl-D-alanine carboxypeptidase/D-alanyl-D-alanine carboxypeptidase (penicillin-binding protein 5/6) [Cohnella sp. SGD-V74]
MIFIFQHVFRILLVIGFVSGLVGYPTNMQAAQNRQDPQELDIHSESAILIDGLTGTILYAKNENKTYYPASITKIVTGIVALEASSPDEIVTVSKEARYEDGTRVFLAEGEQVPMMKLIEGLLMNSGNDAATAIAEHIDGSKEVFAQRMNQFVTEKIGIKNTQFRNPHGLFDSEHYTTAKDMALIAQYAMKNSTFRRIVSTKTKPWNGEEWKSNLVNHNKLLRTYDGATGIKNGFTDESRFTLVGSAMRNGMELIGVVMKSATSNESYSDMTQLLDYGFGNYERKQIMAANETKAYSAGGTTNAFVTNYPIVVTVRKDEELQVTLDEVGNLSVKEGINPSRIITRLSPIEVADPKPTPTPELEIKNETNIWRIFITVLWFLMNLFLGMIAWTIKEKRKTS